MTPNNEKSMSKTRRLVTPEGRVSFPCVFERSDYNDKYEITLVFPASADLSALKKAAKKAVKEKWGNKLPKGLRSPFRKVAEKPDIYSDFEPDDIFVAFRASKRKPGVVDINGRHITDPDELYPGCLARVSATAYAYKVKGNRGVAFGLGNVLKTGDGEPIGGASNAESDFSDLFDENAGDDDVFGDADDGDADEDIDEDDDDDPF